MVILILEDDGALCKGIGLALAAPNRHVVHCHDIKEAKEALRDCSPDLFVVDVNLPDGSGLDFCTRLRADGYIAPVLMLTVNDTELDVVAGFQSGADDYVTKPFSVAVLRARIDALLRRSIGAERVVATDVDGFTFDFEQARFEKQGKTIELSRTEARLLQLLYSNRGQILPRERLLAFIWPDGTEYVGTNALSVVARRLRAKLEDEPSKPRFIKTVHGIGYKWTVNL
jgi:DNA-binding response OmpR family regulator